MVVAGKYNHRLVAWLRGQYGPDKKFKSARRLSLEAGRSPNTVGVIEEVGHATAEVLIDLAGVIGVSPAEVFRIAGWLPENDVTQVLAENDQEVELLEGFRNLPEQGKHWTLGGIQRMLEIPGRPVRSLQIADEEPENHQEGLESTQ